MKNLKTGIIGLLMSAMACSCSGQSIHYNYQDYIYELPFLDQFMICQLSDIHLSTASDLDKEFNYIRNLIYSYGKVKGIPESLSEPDLIILNGDTFMNANKYIVEKTFDFFDSLEIPYAFTYGNHDMQGSYTSNFIRQELKKGEYSVFKDQDNDDVFGNSNYVINLVQGSKLAFQVYIFDSNSFIFGDYDNIHQDQVDWYERMVLSTNGYTSKPEVIDENTFVKSLAFFHIPTQEFQIAIDDFKNKNGEDVHVDGDNFCIVNESVSFANEPTTLIDKMQELKSTVGIGVAHDHINSTDIWYSGDSDWPIRLIYGNKAGNNIYFQEDMMGATFFTINESLTTSKNGNTLYFNLTKVLLNYENEVSIEWENQ